jgi:hypothetical protein
MNILRFGLCAATQALQFTIFAVIIVLILRTQQVPAGSDAQHMGRTAHGKWSVANNGPSSRFRGVDPALFTHRTVGVRSVGSGIDDRKHHSEPMASAPENQGDLDCHGTRWHGSEQVAPHNSASRRLGEGPPNPPRESGCRSPCAWTGLGRLRPRLHLNGRHRNRAAQFETLLRRADRQGTGSPHSLPRPAAHLRIPPTCAERASASGDGNPRALAARHDHRPLFPRDARLLYMRPRPLWTASLFSRTELL